MKLVFAAAFFVAAGSLAAQDEELQRKFYSDVHRALALKPGAIVADIGTGDVPNHPIEIAKAVGNAGRVLCVDIDPKALDKLKKSLPVDATNIEFQLGKPDDPGLPVHTFDSVLISNAYHEMAENMAMLSHIREALKPNGRLVVIETFVEKRRKLSREEQVKNHELPPELLGHELSAAGFEVVSRVEPLFVDGEMIKYLIAAQPKR